MWLLAQKYCLIAMLLLPKAVSTVRRSRETGFADPPSPEREKWLAYPHGASGHGDPNVNVRHYIPAVLGRATVGHLLLPWWDRTLQLAQARRGRWGGGVEAMGMRVSSRGHTWWGGPHLTYPGAQKISQIMSCWQLSLPTMSGCKVCATPASTSAGGGLLEPRGVP